MTDESIEPGVRCGAGRSDAEVENDVKNNITTSHELTCFSIGIAVFYHKRIAINFVGRISEGFICC